MGHIKPKRKVCFVTADGVVHKSKQQAQMHVNRIANKLQEAKELLKTLVSSQKYMKKAMKHHLYRVMSQDIISQDQRIISFNSLRIRYAEKLVAGYKQLLKGE